MTTLKNSGLKLAKVINEDFTRHSVNFNISRYYTDVDGKILNKNTVPDFLKTKFPVYLLGEFDRQGGYKQAFNALPPMAGTYYLGTGVNGNAWSPKSIIGYTGIDEITGKLLVGDIVFIYTDSIQDPNYFIWIVMSSAVVALSSILANTVTTQKDKRFNRLFFESIHYTTTNVNRDQWDEPIIEIRLDNIGLAKTQTLNPTAWEGPYSFLNNILILPYRILVDQFLGLAVMMQYETDKIQFIFKMLK